MLNLLRFVPFWPKYPRLDDKYIAEIMRLQGEVIQLASNSPANLELTYPIGQTRKNQEAVLRAVLGFECPVALLNFEGVDIESICGYPGAPAWTQELTRLSIPREQIVWVDGELVQIGLKKTTNTLTEQMDLARYARFQKYKRIGCGVPRWQALRSLMSAMSACKRHYPELLVFPILGPDLPWDEEVTHSQGQKLGTRAELMMAEALRIPLYQRRGHLPSNAEVFAYLERLRKAA